VDVLQNPAQRASAVRTARPARARPSARERGERAGLAMLLLLTLLWSLAVWALVVRP
jgi:hypothetical protein